MAGGSFSADGPWASLRRTPTVRCIECGRESDARWRGWGAYRVDDPDDLGPPELAFYCPTCAQEELDASERDDPAA